MNRRKAFILLGVLAALLAIAAGSLVYFAIAGGGRGGQTTTNLTPTQGSTGVNVTPIVGGTAHPGTGCGSVKNSQGTYTFSWLHVASDGKVVDENNCIVNLVGFNMAPLFLGDAVGSISAPKVAWYKQTFPMNLVRINFNSTWWDQDVYVPDAGMHFRAWLELNVKWQEQVGNYIELDNGPNFTDPPCGGTVTFCPAQDQGKRDYQANPNPTTALELETNIQPGVQAWTDLAKLYANDPAVVYDAWNEPNIKDIPTFFHDMNTLINTIRAQNPRALLIVYERGLTNIQNGSEPAYQQPNIVFDAHIYPGFNGTSPIDGKHCHTPGSGNPVDAQLQQAVAYAHSHGEGFMIGEWGGCYDVPGYDSQLVSFAKANYLPLTYFAAGDVVVSEKATPLALNGNGLLVKADYTSING
ncbi:MAG TPA: cellulase family glycosylhydrolase [Ktedonobacteraceae bacterium]|nr:cellulase family glycosylhydrolase [Ktedonobacteraceae bacterium]